MCVEESEGSRRRKEGREEVEDKEDEEESGCTRDVIVGVSERDREGGNKHENRYVSE